MLDLSRNGYTHEQIVKQLHAPTLKFDFRYELLDNKNRRKFDLPNVQSATIDHAAFANIKRSAAFSIVEDGNLNIDYLNDRIKPYMRIHIPKGRVFETEYSFFSHIQVNENQIIEDGRLEGWVEFPLGVFLLSSPTRKDDGYDIIREVNAYDGLVILINDKINERLTVLEGASYYTEIVSVLQSAGITTYNIALTDKVLSRSIEYEPGTEKLKIINDLLSQLNYTPLHVDVEGYYTSYGYRSPNERSSDYDYITDNESVIFQEAEEELDLFNVPNVFTVVRTNEEELPLKSTFTNDNPLSPTSTVMRGFFNVDYREIDDIADQEALDTYVQRIAFEASQVYGRIRFTTALMPFHGYSNVIGFEYEPLNIKGKFLEMNWSMDLSVDGKMTHEVRQIINVGGV